MRNLSKIARDLGITVPLFTNDAWEEGSFVVFLLIFLSFRLEMNLILLLERRLLV